MDNVPAAIANIIIMIMKNKIKGKKGYMFVYLKGIHTNCIPIFLLIDDPKFKKVALNFFGIYPL
jgi:hypothetical protein